MRKRVVTQIHHIRTTHEYSGYIQSTSKYTVETALSGHSGMGMIRRNNRLYFEGQC